MSVCDGGAADSDSELVLELTSGCGAPRLRRSSNSIVTHGCVLAPECPFRPLPDSTSATGHHLFLVTPFVVMHSSLCPISYSCHVFSPFSLALPSVQLESLFPHFRACPSPAVERLTPAIPLYFCSLRVLGSSVLGSIAYCLPFSSNSRRTFRLLFNWKRQLHPGIPLVPRIQSRSRLGWQPT